MIIDTHICGCELHHLETQEKGKAIVEERSRQKKEETEKSQRKLGT